MAGRVEWNGEALKAKLDAEMTRRLAASARLVSSHAKQPVSVAGTTKAATKFVGTGTIGKKDQVYKAGRRVYGSNPSRPGEPPHKQEGRLRGSITHQPVSGKLAQRVGTNIDYGRWLELGTANMAARPWLRRALIEKRGEIRLILIKRISS